MGDEIFYIVLIASFMFFFLSFFIVYLAIFQNKRKTIFKQQLLQTQIEIQEQTLKTIAQEIHDNIGQVLSLAKLNLNTFPAVADEAVQKKVEDTLQLVGKAITDLRNLSRSMHGDKINELGLEEAIGSELRILQNTGRFTTQVLLSGNRYKIQPQMEMVLFRMVQEALNNAIKHSAAKNIEVQLQYGTEKFRLAIKDNGIGFNPVILQAAQTGIGLKSMQNRAALIGGIFSVFSAPEKGTTVAIEIANIRPLS